VLNERPAELAVLLVPRSVVSPLMVLALRCCGAHQVCSRDVRADTDPGRDAAGLMIEA